MNYRPWFEVLDDRTLPSSLSIGTPAALLRRPPAPPVLEWRHEYAAPVARIAAGFTDIRTEQEVLPMSVWLYAQALHDDGYTMIDGINFDVADGHLISVA